MNSKKFALKEGSKKGSFKDENNAATIMP